MTDANNTTPQQTPLLGMTLTELQGVAQELGLPRFVAKQMADWLYKKHVATIEEMTNLSKTARQRLTEKYCVGAAAPVDEQRSVDGTVKYLYRTHDNLSLIHILAHFARKVRATNT